MEGDEEARCIEGAAAFGTVGLEELSVQLSTACVSVWMRQSAPGTRQVRVRACASPCTPARVAVKVNAEGCPPAYAVGRIGVLAPVGPEVVGLVTNVTVGVRGDQDFDTCWSRQPDVESVPYLSRVRPAKIMATSGVISSRPWMLAITKMGFRQWICAVREPEKARKKDDLRSLCPTWSAQRSAGY